MFIHVVKNLSFPRTKKCVIFYVYVVCFRFVTNNVVNMNTTGGKIPPCKFHIYIYIYIYIFFFCTLKKQKIPGFTFFTIFMKSCRLMFSVIIARLYILADEDDFRESIYLCDFFCRNVFPIKLYISKQLGFALMYTLF